MSTAPHVLETALGTPLPGVMVLAPVVHEDARGFLMESYHLGKFGELGIGEEFVQDNHSRSHRGVLRGLHYQLRKPQAKLVRVLEGEVFDVAVDLRRRSPTFGQWAADRLSAENRRMIFIPAGFAHGFYVVSRAAEVLYKCTDFYAPEEERGILWSDPGIAIEWPLGDTPPVLSEKDRAYPPLSRVYPEELPA